MGHVLRQSMQRAGGLRFLDILLNYGIIILRVVQEPSVWSEMAILCKVGLRALTSDECSVRLTKPRMGLWEVSDGAERRWRIMKKLQIVMAFLAVFAFSAIAVTTASAEETLLAEWLANKEAFTGSLASEDSGELLIEDSGVGGGMTCSVILSGTVTGGDGVGSITKFLSLEKAEISLENPLRSCVGEGACLKETDIEVAPHGLTWPALMFLTSKGLFLLAMFDVVYFISCLSSLLGLVTDECSAPSAGIAWEVLNVTGGAELMGIGEPKLNCSLGGVGTGVLEAIPGNIIKDGTKTLELSSTG